MTKLCISEQPQEITLKSNMKPNLLLIPSLLMLWLCSVRSESIENVTRPIAVNEAARPRIRITRLQPDSDEKKFQSTLFRRQLTPRQVALRPPIPISFPPPPSVPRPTPASGLPPNFVGPSMTSIPYLRFFCTDRFPGYYADPTTNCQVYHQCLPDGRRYSHLCGIGTVFNQRTLVCDHYYNYDCRLAEQDYIFNSIIRPFPEEDDFRPNNG